MATAETVVFKVKITDANPGAWYNACIGQEYDCILVNAVTGFHGPEICYKVLGKFEPVKYIRLWHGTVTSQHIANAKQSLNRNHG